MYTLHPDLLQYHQIEISEESAETKKIGSIRRAINSNIGKLLVFSAAGYVCWSQAVVVANRVKNTLSPSPLRKGIEEGYGTDVVGWDADIERSGGTLSMFAEYMEGQKAKSHPISVPHLVYHADDIHRRWIHHQVQALQNILLTGSKNDPLAKATDTGNLHIYPPARNRSVDIKTMTHEGMHILVFEIEKKHPEFIAEWKMLASDESGKSRYKLDTTYSTKGDTQEYTLEEMTHCEEWGFVEYGGMLTAYEDIVSYLTLLEMDPGSLSQKLCDSDHLQKNEIMVAKVKLAQLFQAAAKDAFEVVRIYGVCNRAYLDIHAIQQAEEEVEAFCEAFPHSIHIDCLYGCIARLYYEYAMQQVDQKERVEAANTSLDYAHKAFGAKVKHFKVNEAVLSAMENVTYLILQDLNKAQAYRRVREEYTERYYSNDLSVVYKGVGPLLKKENLVR